MILSFISFLFLSFLDFVAAVTECYYSEFIPSVRLPFIAISGIEATNCQTVTELSDLRAATVFTYTDPISAFNCSSITPFTGPQTQAYTPLTSWYTAIVNGTPFPCQNSIIGTMVFTQTTTIYVSYTFPGLTVTSLTPGESIQMVFNPPFL